MLKKILIGILSATLAVVLSVSVSAVWVTIDGKLMESAWAGAKYSVVLQSPSAGVQFAEFYWFQDGNSMYFAANWVDTGDGSGAGGIQIYLADGFGPVLRPGIAYNGDLNLTHKIVVQRSTDYTLEGRLTLPDNQLSNLSQLAVCIIGKSGGITPRGYITTGITAPSLTTTKPASGGGSGSQTTTRVPSGGSGSQTTTKANAPGSGSGGQAAGGNNNAGSGSVNTGEAVTSPNNGGEAVSPNAPSGETATHHASEIISGDIVSSKDNTKGNKYIIMLAVVIPIVILLSAILYKIKIKS